MKNILHLITLQFFRVSGVRKLYLLARILAFVVVLLAFLDPLLRSLVPVELLTLALVAVTTNLALSTIQIIVISAYRRRQRLPTGQADNFIFGV